jgi:hypothetical protein
MTRGNFALAMLGAISENIPNRQTLYGLIPELRVIIDSDLTWPEALEGLPDSIPPEVLARQELIYVDYLGFDGKLHRGQIIVDNRLKADTIEVFAYALEIKFPIEKVIPASQYGWDDDKIMADNNTSGFAWRLATGLDWVSHHGYGFAIDINPVQNPYFKGNIKLPPNGEYNPGTPGTLTKNHPLVKKFKSLGWSWGGDWSTPLDYQHFQKLLYPSKGD